MASHTIADVQTTLQRLGYDPGPIDGAAGPATAAAVSKFQADKGLPTTGITDPVTLAALFPSVVSSSPKTIQGTIADYALNFIKSKTVWAAGALVAVAVGWINTRFGFQIPPELQNTVTGLLVTVFGLLIGVLQTFFNSPHMTMKQPAVVNKPAELK